MRALVISGGGSKGAYAGGVAQYLIKEKGHQYNLFLGTSTGSLLVPHIAADKIDKIYEVFLRREQQAAGDHRVGVVARATKASLVDQTRPNGRD